MDRELRCPVCTEHFQDPVMLHCSHHICSAHIPKTGERLQCPVCGEFTPIPDDGLPVDHALRLVVDLWREQQARGDSVSSSATAPICGACEEKVASNRCITCDGLLCEDCVKTHRTKKLFKGHTIVGLDNEPTSASRWESRMLCADHTEEKLVFYCLDCRVPVCSHCLILGPHKGHQQTQLGTAYQTGRETLQAWVEKLAERISTTDELFERLNDSGIDVQKGAEQQRNQINQEMDHLRDLIETKRSQLLSKSALEEKQKRVQLQSQVDRTTATRGDALKLVSRSEEMLGLSNEHAFLTLVLPLIQDMKKCCGQPVEAVPAGPVAYRPLLTDPQVRCLGDLDLGHPRAQHVLQQPMLHGQGGPHMPPMNGVTSPAHATVSYLPQPAVVAYDKQVGLDMGASPVHQQHHTMHSAQFPAPQAGVPVHQVQYVYRNMVG